MANPYRDPETGRYITLERWEQLQAEAFNEFEDYEDFDEFEQLGEEELY